jgi:Transmembrane domain of unknown function (DUF3566)
MPADPSGVTTDDHGEGEGGAEQRPEEPIPGSGPVADPHAGLPPVAGAGGSDGNGSKGHDEAGLPSMGGADVTGSDGGATGSQPGVAATDPRSRYGDGPSAEASSPWSTFTPASPASATEEIEGAPAAPASEEITTAAPAIGPEVDPNGTKPGSAGVHKARGARRFAGRVRSRRAPKPKARRGLRVRQRLWSFDPWSVFKLSVLFYICVCLIVVVAGTLLWNVGRSVGTIDDVENFITRMGAYGTCTLKAEVPAGTPFEQDDDCADDEVLVGGYQFDDGTIFRAAAIGGGILVVAGSIGNVLLVALLNLLNELTGGLRYTVVKEPIPRQPAGRQRGGRAPGARGGGRAPGPRAAAGRPDGPRHAAKHRAPSVPSMGDGGDGDDREEPIRVPVVEGSTDRGTQG